MSGDFEFSWAVVPEGIGEIDENGVFTAGQQVGTCTVICTCEDKTATATVKVYDPEKPPVDPTETNLTAIAEQLIADTHRVGETIGYLMENNVATAMERIEKHLAPYLPAIEKPLELSASLTMLIPNIVFCPPDTYTWDELMQTSPEDELQVGTWTITMPDDQLFYAYPKVEEEIIWAITLMREAPGENEEFRFTMTNNYESELNYRGTITVPTTIWEKMEAQPGGEEKEERPDVIGSIALEMQDSVFAPSTFSAAINYDGKDADFFNVDCELRFVESSDYIKLNGNITTETREKERTLGISGTVETADLNLTGDINATLVENSKLYDPEDNSPFAGYYPSKLTLDGTFTLMGVDVLNGQLSWTCANAAIYNPEGDYSPENWLDGTFTLSGQLKGDQYNAIEMELVLDEIAFCQAEMWIAAALEDSGVSRQLTVALNNVEDMTIVEVEISSTWGPARIEMELIYGNGLNEKFTDAEGTVKIGETKVGTVSLDGDGLKVTYNDGTYETF